MSRVYHDKKIAQQKSIGSQATTQLKKDGSGGIDLIDNRKGSIQCKGCIECGGKSKHAATCSRAPKPRPAPPPPTAEQMEARARAIHARMAATHHQRTGVRGTPPQRQEARTAQNLQDVRDRLAGGGGAGAGAGGSA